MSFYCRKCGREHSSLYSLTSSPCSKGGYDEPYEGRESGPYHCRKCGREHSSLYSLTSSPCSKGGYDEPL